MTKHIIDHMHVRAGQRLARFARIERLRGVKLRPQAVKLRRAARPLDNSARLLRYLRMQRQED
ncbi:MAG: hypothetical protein KJO15_18025 [Alphaproteobacteria bacterium]|jgi:hypothetical protein|nr:hypothetical protein [Alphaproteobacteria bacterium]NNF71876.1 hypothetical protein [Paracoccaceae bacterium]